MKKKILLLANHAIIIYNFRMELVQRLVADGYEVYLAAPYNELIDEIIKEKCIFKETHLERRSLDPFKDIQLIREYKKLYKEINPDIIFSYTIKPNIYGSLAARNADIPFVANITGLGSAMEKRGLLSSFVILLYKLAFRKVQRVFFQNRDNLSFFEQHNIAVGKHKLLPGSGVNLERFTVQEYPQDDVVKFAFISRIMKEKGIEEYLHAACEIREKYSRAEFHICGFCEEAYEKKIAELQEKQIVTYHGMVKDIRTVLSGIHCVVLPSYHEGMSNVLLEASAAGRPCIATDIAGCKEIVMDSETGYLVEPKSSASLYEKIEKFMTLSFEEKKQMGLKARRLVEDSFDRQQVVDAYMKEIYE